MNTVGNHGPHRRTIKLSEVWPMGTFDSRRSIQLPGSHTDGEVFALIIVFSFC